MKRSLPALPDAALLVSHRCLPHCHALRFARWRAAYRRCLPQALRAARPLQLLDYLITRDSVYALVMPAAPALNTAFMQSLQGQSVGLFKTRFPLPGPIWHGRHSLTLVQAGHALVETALAMDLHMCTTGRVRHPAEWRDTGWQELSGTRRRWRVLNPVQARQHLLGDSASPESSADRYITLTETCLRQERFGLLPRLSSALAIGERAWIRRLAALIPESRRTVRNLAPELLPIPADNLAMLCVSQASRRYYIASFIRHFGHRGKPRAKPRA
jgi:hypothetical protein